MGSSSAPSIPRRDRGVVECVGHGGCVGIAGAGERVGVAADDAGTLGERIGWGGLCEHVSGTRTALVPCRAIRDRDRCR